MGHKPKIKLVKAPSGGFDEAYFFTPDGCLISMYTMRPKPFEGWVKFLSRAMQEDVPRGIWRVEF